MPRRFAVALLVLIAAVHASPAPLRAQPDKLEIAEGDTVKGVLERQAGKRVSVVLSTGQELSGVVSKVTRDVVHLSELSGREFFDAVIPLDRITAVVIRVRAR